MLPGLPGDRLRCLSCVMQMQKNQDSQQPPHRMLLRRRLNASHTPWRIFSTCFHLSGMFPTFPPVSEHFPHVSPFMNTLHLFPIWHLGISQFHLTMHHPDKKGQIGSHYRFLARETVEIITDLWNSHVYLVLWYFDEYIFQFCPKIHFGGN